MSFYQIAFFRAILAASMAFSFCARATQDVYLAWAPSFTPDVSGYALYFGNAPGAYDSRLDVGTNTTAVVTNLLGGQSYFFAAVAYDADGAESIPSGEVTFTVPTPPSPLLVAQVSQDSGTLIFNWTAVSDQHYQLQYATDLNQITWSNVGNSIVLTNGAASLSVSIRSDPQGFYRLKLVP